jgi:hypothetical protein
MKVKRIIPALLLLAGTLMLSGAVTALPAHAATCLVPPHNFTNAALLNQALAGNTSAHLLGLSPASLATIPDEETEAQSVNHAMNIVNLFTDWNTTAATMTSRFQSAAYCGAIPEITWMPCSFTPGCSAANNTFPLTQITAGAYDSYITSIAQAAVTYAKPVILRPFHEMNGNWYPWGAGVNGNTPAQLIAAWQHVYGIFTAQGATNVHFLWTPNKHGPNSDGTCNLCQWYPGEAYTAFTGVDGYNGSQYSNTWMWPATVFGTSFSQFPSFTTRPVIIGEVGTTEASAGFACTGYTLDQCKSQWISQFVSYLAGKPDGLNVEGFVWSEFNSTKAINTSPAAQSAMTSALATSWVSG